MSDLQIEVYGIPAPKGSKRFVGLSKSGRGILIESSKREKPWAESVKWAALEARNAAKREGQPDAIAGAVEVEMVFTVPKPKSAPKTRRTWPDKKPDLSKLVRSTEDALTEVGAWEDDARVVRCVSKKVFPCEDADALQMPGAVIRIRVASAQ